MVLESVDIQYSQGLLEKRWNSLTLGQCLQARSRQKIVWGSARIRGINKKTKCVISKYGEKSQISVER